MKELVVLGIFAVQDVCEQGQEGCFPFPGLAYSRRRNSKVFLEQMMFLTDKQNCVRLPSGFNDTISKVGHVASHIYVIRV